jgi:catechol 2,3-dioxygenase-like lactoylglutathione lyase family enzyme
MHAEHPPSAPPVPFRSNCEIAIHVPDLARAEAFYAGVLGFRVVARAQDQLEIDTGALRLFVNRDPDALRTYIPSLDVPDYAAARRHLEAAGCSTVPAGPHDQAVYFQDPFGFVFDIIERG